MLKSFFFHQPYHRYVEMAIVRCNRFLSDNILSIKQDLDRIAQTMRGIGDPLMAICARAYLARKGLNICLCFFSHNTKLFSRI